MISYETKELNFAAFLWCCPGVELVNAKIHPQRRDGTVLFVFNIDRTEETFNALKMSYYNKKERIEPILFAEKQTALRDLLFDRQGIEVKKKENRNRE